MSIFDRETVSGGEVQKTPHRPYRYLVTDGVTHDWVHCPVCYSQNNGWWEGGVPRYSGGFLHVRFPPPGGGEPADYTVACLCAEGKARKLMLGMTIADCPPTTEYLSQPGHILFVHGLSQHDPPNPDPRAAEDYEKMQQWIRKQVALFLDHKLELATLAAKVQTAVHGYLKHRGLVCPTVEDVMRDRALRDLYFQPELTKKPAAPSVPKDRTPYKD